MRINKFAYFLLLIIIIIGSYLRLYKFYGHMNWIGDIGREILIGKHIVNDRNLYFISTTSSEPTLVKNTPVLYLIAAFFWLISGSEEGVFFSLAIASILLIYICFLIGYKLINTETGIICSLLAAVNFSLIHFGRHDFMSVLLLITALNILLHLIFLEKKKSIYILLIIGASFIGISFHFAYLPVFMANLFLTLFYLLVFHKKNISAWLIIILCTLAIFFAWLKISGNQPFSYFEFIQTNFHYSYAITTLINDLKRVSIFTFNTDRFYLIYIFTFILMLIFSIIDIRRKSFKSFILMFLMLSFSVLILYPMNKEPQHFSPFYFIFIITSVYIVTRFFKTRILRIILFYYLIYFSLNKVNYYYVRKIPNYEKYSIREASFRIYSDYKKLEDLKYTKNDFLIYTWLSGTKPALEWYTGSFWFFLENTADQRLVKLVNNGSGIEPLNKNAKIFYLICVMNKPLINKSERCRSDFYHGYVAKLQAHVTRIENQGFIYDIFRYRSIN